MNWRVFVDYDGPVFVTGDNPVSFTRDIGLGHPDAELTFPISSSAALVATWRSDRGSGYYKADDHIIGEINRRTIKGSTRYVFFEREVSWIPKVIRKPNMIERAL